MVLPITVIVPHSQRRRDFFGSKVLPSILTNDPTEIVVELDGVNACDKRNRGAAKATQPYLFFCDDDCVLMPDCLPVLLQALEADPGASFAYGDGEHVFYDAGAPSRRVMRKSRPWDPRLLRQSNYIDTGSLMRRGHFPLFDPAIKRFQDWDLWLTFLREGRRGTYVGRVTAENHFFDAGISSSVPLEAANEAIRKKHVLL
jgi:hypothetical protein